MSRMTCYLLACTMALATVMGMDPGPGAPQWGIGYQCQNRGYDGACISQNEFKGELTCLSLVCAVRERGGHYRAVPTGPVNDGTLCGLNRVCKRGVCVPQTPTDISFPIGNDPRFHCESLPVARISGYPPGSNPERNRPAIEIPSVSGGEPVRLQIPSPWPIRASRPAASTSTRGQISAPAASRPRGRPRLTPAASTSTGSQTSAPAASRPRGRPRLTPAASTSTGSQGSAPAASRPRGRPRLTPAASTSTGSQGSAPAASTSTGGQRSAPVASTSTGTQPSRSAPYPYERRH